MPTNKDFLKRLGAKNACFYLADFHVHSPASHDFRGPQKVESTNPEVTGSIGDLQHLDTLNAKARHEEIVLRVQKLDAFYNALLARRDKLTQTEGISESDNWAFVAVTDHDVCKFSSQLSIFSWERRKENRLITLPGIELSVRFKVPDTNDTADVHLLLVFAPVTTSEQIYQVINNAGPNSWEFGDTLEIDDLPLFVKSVREHQSHPAICIAAHVWSSKGVREEAKKCILTYLEAEVSRIEGEIVNSESSQRKSLEAKRDALRAKLDQSEAVPIDVLKLIGTCGFDALQTRGTKDESFYRRLHRFREGFGRAVSIVSSDAHDADAVFAHTDTPESVPLIPYIKLTQVSGSEKPSDLLNAIKNRALRFGETRTTQRSPEFISSWIEGIEVIPDAENATKFWPFRKDENDIPMPFTVELSQNLTCVIGGRGSGKSALIEAISFMSGSGQEAFTNKKNHSEDWYRRAQATLRGCRIRVCWRILLDLPDPLRKKALFAERYFDGDHGHTPITLSNYDGQEQLPGTISLPHVEVFRIHDIEDAARPERLRALFDKICGSEVTELSSQIAELTRKLEEQRLTMVEVAESIAELTTDDSALRQYARRKEAFDNVNKKEIREQFEQIDSVAFAEKRVTQIEKDWETLRESFNVESQKSRVEEFFGSAQTAITETDEGTADAPDNGERASIKPYCGPISDALDGQSEPAASMTSKERIVNALNNLDSEMDGLGTRLNVCRTGIEDAHREFRDKLSEQGHPTGSAERETKKKAFEDAEQALKDYREQWKKWNKLASNREELFAELELLAKKRTTVRQITAEKITNSLAVDLDPTILQIVADAQPKSDIDEYIKWFNRHIDWTAQHKVKRFERIAQSVLPQEMRRILVGADGATHEVMVNDESSALEGKITATDASKIVAANLGLHRLEPEVKVEQESEVIDLPSEVKEGLLTFPPSRQKTDVLAIDAILKLDEVVLDDLPVIKLNDRPMETDVLKPLERLSPGQRCTAILPILLLNGTYPIVIDQPEDNLDTRLIRQVIVNVLSSIKLRRQVIVATHNPNIPVLGDAEQVIVLRAVADEQCDMEAKGDLDDKLVVRNITEIMEGGREAFQYRQSIYHVHWTGGADDFI